MEDTLTAITRTEEQKAELEQDNGSDTRTGAPLSVPGAPC